MNPDARSWTQLFAAYGLLRKALRDLLAWHVGFEALTLVVFGPLAGLLVRQFVAASGYDAVGNVEIATFLLRPTEAGLFLGLVSLRVALSFVRAAGILTIGDAALAGRRLRASAALRRVVAKVPAVVGLSACGLLALAVLLAPLIGVALLTARWLLTAHDINYYLAETPPEYWVAVTIGAGLALAATWVALLVVARTVFAMTLVMFACCGPIEALAKARELLSGRHRRMAASLALWFLASVAISLAANAVIHGTADWLIDRVPDRLDWLAITLGVVAAVSAGINFAVEFVASASLDLLLLLEFRAAAAVAGLKLPSPGEDVTPVPRRPALRRLALVAGAAAAMVWAAGAIVALIEDQGFVDRVKITAHRGASSAAPENTLAAIQAAIDAQADYAEIDVQLTSDGMLVVNHDADLMRVGRSPLVIGQSTLEQLLAVDLGQGWGPEFSGQRVPTLDQVIDAAEGRIRLVVELKSYRGDPSVLVQAVAQVFERRKMREWAVMMSLKYPEVEEFGQLDPVVRRGFIVSASLGDAARLDVDFLAVSERQATDALIAESHARDREVFVWTIDNPAVASQLIDLGVDNLITNDPKALRALLNERAELSDTERLLLRFRHWYED